METVPYFQSMNAVKVRYSVQRISHQHFTQQKVHAPHCEEVEYLLELRHEIALESQSVRTIVGEDVDEHIQRLRTHPQTVIVASQL